MKGANDQQGLLSSMDATVYLRGIGKWLESAAALAAMVLLVLWPKFIGLPVLGQKANPYILASSATLLLFFALRLADFAAIKFYKLPRLRMTWPVAVVALFLINVLVEMFSFAIGSGHSDRSAALPLLIRDLIGIKGAFVLGAIIGERRTTSRRGAQLFAAAVAASLAIAAVEKATGMSLFKVLSHFLPLSADQSTQTLVADKVRDGTKRFQSVYDHPIILGIMASVGCSFGLSWVFSKTRLIERSLGLLLLALTIPAILSSGSRSAFVGIAITLVAFVVVRLVRSLVVRGATSWLIPLSILALAVVPVAYIKSGDLVTSHSSAELRSNVMRQYQWEKGWPAIEAHPLIGRGIGSDITLGGTVTSAGALTIDDSYLSLLLTNGWVGAAAFGMFVAAVILGMFRSVTKWRLEGEVVTLVAFIMATVVIVITQSQNSIQFCFAIMYLFAGWYVSLDRVLAQGGVLAVAAANRRSPARPSRRLRGPAASPVVRRATPNRPMPRLRQPAVPIDPGEPGAGDKDG